PDNGSTTAGTGFGQFWPSPPLIIDRIVAPDLIGHRAGILPQKTARKPDILTVNRSLIMTGGNGHWAARISNSFPDIGFGVVNINSVGGDERISRAKAA